MEQNFLHSIITKNKGDASRFFELKVFFEKTVKNTFNLQKISIKYYFNLIQKLKEPMTNQE